MDTLIPTDRISMAAPAPSHEPGSATLQARLREATEDDRPELLALHRAALVSLSLGHYTEAQIQSLLRHVPTLDASLLADRSYLVAELDGRIVACGGWSARIPGYLPVFGQGCASPDKARAPLIRAMYTHPAYARRGLGRQILAAAERAALSHCSQALELDALLAGVPLYLSAGYQPLGRSSWRLPNGEEIAIVRMRQRRSQPKSGMRIV
ncbi:MAG: GNAT family N-acetyltransferase [Piscinibacter sp.]|nr:GNAT family N-acetyltransferase [Piscinibacter sp.]